MGDGVGLSQHSSSGRERVKKARSTSAEDFVVAMVLHDRDHDVIKARHAADGAQRRMR
jgi:hypothetical protein